MQNKKISFIIAAATMLSFANAAARDENQAPRLGRVASRTKDELTQTAVKGKRVRGAKANRLSSRKVSARKGRGKSARRISRRRQPGAPVQGNQFVPARGRSIDQDSVNKAILDKLSSMETSQASAIKAVETAQASAIKDLTDKVAALKAAESTPAAAPAAVEKASAEVQDSFRNVIALDRSKDVPSSVKSLRDVVSQRLSILRGEGKDGGWKYRDLFTDYDLSNRVLSLPRLLLDENYFKPAAEILKISANDLTSRVRFIEDLDIKQRSFDKEPFNKDDVIKSFKTIWNQVCRTDSSGAVPLSEYLPSLIQKDSDDKEKTSLDKLDTYFSSQAHFTTIDNLVVASDIDEFKTLLKKGFGKAIKNVRKLDPNSGVFLDESLVIVFHSVAQVFSKAESKSLQSFAFSDDFQSISAFVSSVWAALLNGDKSLKTQVEAYDRVVTSLKKNLEQTQEIKKLEKASADKAADLERSREISRIQDLLLKGGEAYRAAVAKNDAQTAGDKSLISFHENLEKKLSALLGRQSEANRPGPNERNQGPGGQNQNENQSNTGGGLPAQPKSLPAFDPASFAADNSPSLKAFKLSQRFIPYRYALSRPDFLHFASVIDGFITSNPPISLNAFCTAVEPFSRVISTSSFVNKGCVAEFLDSCFSGKKFQLDFDGDTFVSSKNFAVLSALSSNGWAVWSGQSKNDSVFFPQ